jgi:hypothetical protein
MRRLMCVLVLVFLVQGATLLAGVPSIRSNISSISIRDGSRLKSGSWVLAPEADPDVYRAGLVDGKAHTVTFITDVDSIKPTRWRTGGRSLSRFRTSTNWSTSPSH